MRTTYLNGKEFCMLPYLVFIFFITLINYLIKWSKPSGEAEDLLPTSSQDIIYIKNQLDATWQYVY